MDIKLDLRGKRLVLFVMALVVLVVLSALIGVGIQSVASSSGCSSQKNSASTPKNIYSPKEEEKMRLEQHSQILNAMKADNIKSNLRYLTLKPHLAGTIESKEQADYVAQKWRENGFDQVKTDMYTILLSYPMKPGEVSLSDKNGTKLHEFKVVEPAVTKEENMSSIVLPFNAYSPAGTVEGELVYANYGRYSDFVALKKAGIDVKGKIVMMRYGPTSRGSKVANAQMRGANGVILFSDPQNWNPHGENARYPKGWELPTSGIQRGTIIRRQGDALSREYPSKDGFYRLNETKASPLPTIPSQPIQFNDAVILLRQMDGMNGSSSFQGAAKFIYRMNSTLKIRLTVHTKLESRPTYTVSGVIYGKMEPDRLVLLGNHRDAWTSGAGDASSGQAALLEIGRALGTLKKKGWRPRRSIMLCSWDAEEYGIHGSTEWVEDHASMLQEQAIAYLNVDIAVEGNYTVRLRGTPELDNAFFEATKKVPAPDDAKVSLFDDWLKKNRNPSIPTEPKTIVATSGSDYKPFYQTLGISCVDLRYMFSKQKGVVYPYMYPMYHSRHDTFEWMTKFVDPDYRYHLTVGKMWLKLGLLLADSLILPFNLPRAAAKVDYYANKFDKDHKKYLQPQGISCGTGLSICGNFDIDNLKSEEHEEEVGDFVESLQSHDLLVSAASNLTKAVAGFAQRLKKIDLTNPLKVRMMNDRIQNFQRQFVHQVGTMGRDDLRNVVYATRANQMRTGNKFSAVGQAIYRAYNGIDKDWDEVKKQLMLVVYHLQSAARSYEKLGM